ncbi:MAG: TolC family protein [Bacteroidota bacterium]
MQKILLTFCVLLGATLLWGQSTQPITLDAFLAAAQRQALGHYAAEQDRTIAEARLRLFQARLRPQLRATANIPNYNKTFSEITQPDGTVLFQAIENNNSALSLDLRQALPWTGGQLFVQAGLQRFDDLENEATLYNGAPYRVGISQPIFQYNDLKWQRQLAPLRWEVAQRQYQADQARLRTEATQLYFDLLLASQERTLADTNLMATQRLYAIAQERFTLGKISKRDLLQLELELRSAEAAQIRQQQNAAAASARMATYLGVDPATVSYQASLPTAISSLEISEELALQKAIAQRPEWTAFAQRLLAARRAVDEAKRSGGPALSLNASVGRIRSSDRLADIYENALPETYLELRIDVPILDGGQRRQQRKIAAAQQQFTTEAVAREQLNLANEVRQTVRDVQTLQRELSLVEQVKTLADERFRITTESYVLGAISLTERTLAQREREQALRTYLATLQAYWLTEATLKEWLVE